MREAFALRKLLWFFQQKLLAILDTVNPPYNGTHNSSKILYNIPYSPYLPHMPHISAHRGLFWKKCTIAHCFDSASPLKLSKKIKTYRQKLRFQQWYQSICILFMPFENINTWNLQSKSVLSLSNHSTFDSSSLPNIECPHFRVHLWYVPYNLIVPYDSNCIFVIFICRF